MKSKITYFLVFFCSAFASFSQIMPEKGVPLMKIFTPDQYLNSGKVWGIASAPSGIVYMATDRGLLEFDGKNWKTHVGSAGITRALLVVNDSLIFTGSDLDFGVWRKNKYHTLAYHSLYPYRNDVQDIIEEFWDVHQIGDQVVFISSQNIYVYKKGQLVKIAAPVRFAGSFPVDNKLYVADRKEGLFLFDGFKLKKVFDFPQNFSSEISGIYQQANGLVIVTREMGLYRYQSGMLTKLASVLSQKLEKGKVFGFEPVGKSHVAYGTVLQGLFIADLNGKIIHHINRNKGLPVNTILSLHYNPCGKLWLGMDYGVSVINLENSFTTFFDYRGDFGTASAASLKDGFFNLGTNQGLYRAKWEELNNDAGFFNFSLISGTEGQVWAVEEIDNTLLMGHDKGLFIIKDKTIEKISDQEGVWTIIKYKDHLLTGNYNGISVFGKAGGKWKFLKKMDLIYGSCNQLIVEEDHFLWINIPSFGIIRAELDNDLHPAERSIFPEEIFKGSNTFITSDAKGIHVNTELFRYTYDSKKNKFIKGARILQQELPFSSGQKYRQLNRDYNFYPVHNGFVLQYLKVPGNPVCSDNLSLVFRGAEAFNNENNQALSHGERIPFRLNNLRINFIVPNQDNVLYQYKTSISEDWSSWVSDDYFEFLNVNHGVFTFDVRAKLSGKISEIKTISFRISPPWYQSWYAWILYFSGFVLLFYSLKTIHDISLRKQKQKLLLREQHALQRQAEKHKEDIMLLEQARLKGDYDQLKDLLKTKTIALANKARENEEKNRLILTLKEKCELGQNNPTLAKSKWREMQRLLEAYLEMEDKTFEIQMDELHQEFFKKLKSRFSDLSNNDLRMCAYLKIGLNSKEVSEILNIQPSSFYISRSRLRKKLNLKTKENLFDFLNAI